VLAAKVDTAKRLYNEGRTELDLHRSEIWSFGGRNRVQIGKELAALRARFDSSQNLSVLVGEMTETVRRLDLTVTQIAPREKTSCGSGEDTLLSHFDCIPMELSLTGPYEKLGRFLSALGWLERGVVSVQRVRLNQAGTGQDLLNLSLLAHIYVRKEGKMEAVEEKDLQELLSAGEPRRSRFHRFGETPFLERPEPGSKKLVNLEGIIFDAKAPLALIDGEVKKVGDTVNGMQIVEIKPDRIALEGGGERLSVELRR